MRRQTFRRRPEVVPSRTPVVRALMALLLILASAAMATPASAEPGVTASIFLNEVHYDNSGADTGEFVEVAGPAGIDLSGWTVALYNGSDGAVYDTIVVSGTIPDEGSGFGAVSASSDEGSIQNGGPDGLALVDPSSEVVQFWSYEGVMTATDGPADGLVSTDLGVSEQSTTPIGSSLQLTGIGVVANDFAWTGPVAGSPGLLNDGQTVGGEQPGDVTLISDIQGAVPAPDPDVPTPFPSAGDPADDSPLVGDVVTISGVVTGWDDLAGQANSGSIFHTDRGIFVQEEDADTDGDPTTSEGIYVQFSTESDDVEAFQLGDLVEVTGTVAEHFELTVISSGATITTVSSGNPLPTAVVVDATIDRDGWEEVEGQRVTLAEGVANSGGTNRFGELIVTPGPTADIMIRPDVSPGLVALVGEAGAGNPAIPRKPEAPSPATVTADLFDTVQNATGPVGYTFGLYKIFVQPGDLPTVVDTGVDYPFSGVEPAGPGQVRVTALNVENFFPVGVVHDGAAVETQEYENKRDRIVDAVDRLLRRPDIVGVEEVADLAILQDVAATLGGYTAVLEEGNDNRGIDVGFLIKDTVTLNGTVQLGRTAADPTTDSCGDVDGLLFDRPPLLVDVTVQGATFAVINNHWSSKAAPDSCRNAQATFVRDEVAALEAAGTPVVVTGDLNAFEDDSPLAILEDGNTTLDNLWDTVPADEAYSFQFAGVLQTLDHMLVTDGLAAFSPELAYAHFGSAYFDRQLEQPTLTGPFSDGHKVSDHDPPVLTLTVNVGGDLDSGS